MQYKNNVDKQYSEMLNYILKNGRVKKDRTGTGTISVFDYNMKFDMSEGFPIVTGKKVSIKNVYIELLWFLGIHMQEEKYQKFGLTNLKYLVDNKCNIWVGDAYKKYSNMMNKNEEIHKEASLHIKSNYRPEEFVNVLPFTPKLTEQEFIQKILTDDDFAIAHGDLGAIYGKQWIDWNGNNQINEMINLLKTDPDSRRIMLNSYNISELKNMILNPCHFGFQLYTFEMSEMERANEWRKENGKSAYYNVKQEYLNEIDFPKRKISLKFLIRSNDVFLGNPYNLSSYAILLQMFAQTVNMIPDMLSCTIGDAHIYLNHIDQVKEYLQQPTFALPSLNIKRKITDIFDFKLEDIELINYKYAKVIKAPLSN